MSELSPIGKQLADRLIELWDDEEFVVGTLSTITTDEEYLEMLRFMDNYEDVNVETVTVFAIRLKQQRKQSQSQ